MPRLSVVVVTHQSAAFVGPVLRALAGELEEGDEVVVVDNASDDGTAAVVADALPAARVLPQSENLGFAAGANAGAAAARGDLLVLLNPDAAPAPGFGAAIRAPWSTEPGWGAWQALVTAEDGRLINTSGGVVHFTGIAWAGRAGEPIAASPSARREVAFASGACLAVRRAAWDAVGGFPPEFFMYHEDVDLALRLRLRGWGVGLEPAARVDHDYDFGKGPAKWRRLEANRWATILRCYPAPLLLAVAPALLATELALLPVALAGGWGREKLRAWGDVLGALPRLRRERRAIQTSRTGSFAAWLTPELDSAYLGRAGRSRALNAALRAYWALARQNGG